MFRSAPTARFRTAPFAAALLALAPAAAADVSLFLGPEGGVGTVVVFDEAGPSAPLPVAGLVDVQLLPIEGIGRTHLETFLDGRVRLRNDIPGATRLELPSGQGSIYRFRRDRTLGSQFGFFQVGADGRARVVLELAGTGLLASDDPFHAAVASDPLGSALLVASTLAAGGNVYEVELATGVAIDRTANLAPLDLLPTGLGLRASFGVAAASDRLVRFLRLPGELAVEVALPGAPTWFGGEFVFSDSGFVCATIAGSAPTAAFPYAFAFAGPAARLSNTPAHLSPAGFLPDSIDGPYLALSADGSVCVWRTEGALARDAWTSNVALVPPPPQPITSDPQFVDTLDEVGLAGSFAAISPRAILLAVGEVDDPQVGGIEGLDFYLVETALGGGLPAITNLTLTSGITNEPFDAGNIDPTRGAWRVPGTQRILVRDDAGSGSRLSMLDLAAATVTPLASNVDEVRGIERVGSRYLVAAEEVGVSRRLLVVDAAALSSQTLASLGPQAVFDRFAVRTDGFVGLGLRVGALDWAALVHLPTGTGDLISPLPFDFGPAMAWTPSGQLCLSGGLPGTDPIFVGLGVGTPSFLAPVAPQPGFVLPGA